MRANNHQLMTKALVKAIMTRSRLKNGYWKSSSKNSENYKKQSNFCKNLLEKAKSEYFRNLNINKRFWKKIEPFFSDKGLETNNSKKKRINY